MQLLNISKKILCSYTNPTSRMQILRISNIENFFLERAVVPQGSVFFETFREARLEIHTSEMMSAILSDVIPCSELIVGAQKYRQQNKRVPQIAC
ncbi:MAG: DUF1830 domain-containing protein [Cyanobacteria bacterium P01_D01_bin.105]